MANNRRNVKFIFGNNVYRKTMQMVSYLREVYMLLMWGVLTANM